MCWVTCQCLDHVGVVTASDYHNLHFTLLIRKRIVDQNNERALVKLNFQTYSISKTKAVNISATPHYRKNILW